MPDFSGKMSKKHNALVKRKPTARVLVAGMFTRNE